MKVPRILFLLFTIILMIGLSLQLAAGDACAAVTLDGVANSNADDDVSSLSISHTTGTGEERLMLVGVSWNCGTTDRSISSVTFTPSGGSAIPLTVVITQQGVNSSSDPPLLGYLQIT